MHSALRRLDLNLLLAFDALYRHRSVTSAAAELAISASAFSHALGRLREALNDELFIRQGNRMHPTHRAELLMEPVASALKTLAEGLGQWEPFVPAFSQRTFTFAATDYTAFALLPALMQRLQMEAPGIRVRLVQSERKVSIEDLASGRIDFALGYSEGRDQLPGGVEVLDWLTDRYLVIARRGHPRVRGTLDLVGYLAERHVVVTPWNESSGAIDHVLEGMGLQREVAVQLPTVMAAPFIVGSTDLLMTVPGHAARTLQQVAGVELYPAPFEIPPYALRLYSHAKYARSDAHAWMLEQLRSLRVR
ncbi:LysR family transcriptional regulator [Metapseudomonas lalkuanensis]|uniref:LysR family transcriptional regulator n=1 Tax=Metapseudomonas lalkuanensis TaxID=2604832 RepID=A0A5J6QLK1_9GAMM|nr:LysR family transcriptional regulator [Pseudomonas lalkuanensis]QEY62635.1 LysR family transcriptional regulator [Pseudomonas lalkuanensis]UCO96141.1 LysR family transcriptional regulator [Pseudomonas lalkuanensis]